MQLSEEQIQRLLDWFLNSSETRKKWAEHRKKAYKENHAWIQPDKIKKMSNKELELKFLNYYKSGGGRQSLNQIYRDRIIRDIKRFKEEILYLLDEDIDIRDRIDQSLGGTHHIEGFGKAILTSFLMDYDSSKYCLWNNKTEMGFSTLGLKVFERKDFWGKAYLKILEALKRIGDLKPEYGLTLDEIDLFLHTISAEDEGREAVVDVIEGREISTGGKQVPETADMEFAMEKYLEDFIEANFSKIKFGEELELYQDEENTGRQYSTSIGNIDLLAFDKKNKEFVVIELKKGRSSDTVVGQVLRYMGYIKDNLAKDYGVRGIIIVKEKDERLEYALKLMTKVDLFMYKVSFDLEKVSQG